MVFGNILSESMRSWRRVKSASGPDTYGKHVEIEGDDRSRFVCRDGSYRAGIANTAVVISAPISSTLSISDGVNTGVFHAIEGFGVINRSGFPGQTSKNSKPISLQRSVSPIPFSQMDKVEIRTYTPQ